MPGDTRNKLNPTQRIAVKREIADRYVKGEFQAAIAEAVGLSQGQVSQYLAKIEAEWARQYAAQIDAAKWAQLAKIDALERTYWQAWADSQQAINRQTQYADVSDPAAPARPTRVAQVTEERSGDMRALVGIQWCISERCKILGLYAPQKVAPTNPEGTREWQPGPNAVQAVREQLLTWELDRFGTDDSAPAVH